MFRTYLTLAARNLRNHRLYSFLNIFGLAVGVAACLLLFRLIHYELSFDTHHRNYDRIVRIITRTFSAAEGENFTPGIPIPAMDVLQSNVSQFSAFARIHSMEPTITVPGAPGSLLGKKIPTDPDRETGVFVEPGFFEIFDFEWLAGDPRSALAEPGGVVLNRSMAEKCFGDWQEAMGQTVVMDNKIPLMVRGVVADAPLNSNFPFHVMVAYETIKAYGDFYNYHPDWGSTSSSDQVYALLGAADQRAAAEAVAKTVGQDQYVDIKRGGAKEHLLQPLSEMHFNDRIGTLGNHQTSRPRLAVLAAIGLLILIMACFNFINLATAQAVGRAREVGVRKTLGSSRGQLIRQFMSETTLIVLCAVAAGAALAALAAPWLKHISDVPDATPFLSNPALLLFLAVLTLAVSLVSGFYPALVLARFNPVQALKNKLTTRVVGGVSLRKSLVVLQFVIAQALIGGTLVVISQMEFIRGMDLGFQPNLVYTVRDVSSDSASVARFDAFRQQLLQLPAVEAVSFSTDVPASENTWSSNFALGAGADDAPFGTSLKFADADYFKTYGLRLVAGRGMAPSDTLRELVVNQTLLRRLGIANPEEAVGKELRLGGRRNLVVVGVVEDFHTASAHQPIAPITIGTRKKFYGTVGLKIRPENLEATAAAVEKTFESTFPEQVFNGQFMDESIAEFYRDENRFSAMCKGFAALAILISCLGLFGLASHMAGQRTKEIGVRKVLGASVGGIIGLLARDFLKLVVVAILIASPLAWWGMNKWLQDFVHRIDIQWWMFAGAGALAILIAFLTVGGQSVRAALANPVDSLKSE
jgi:putative ABC transport system permease protein